MAGCRNGDMINISFTSPPALAFLFNASVLSDSSVGGSGVCVSVHAVLPEVSPVAINRQVVVTWLSTMDGERRTLAWFKDWVANMPHNGAVRHGVWR